MDITRRDSRVGHMIRRMIWVLPLSCLVLTAALAAQVTVSGNGSTSTNGLTLTEGTNISAVSGSETLWADSTDGRLKVTNHGVSTQFDLALWPCRLSPGGILVAATTTTLGVYQETCPAGLTFVAPVLTVGSTGSNGKITLTNSGNSNSPRPSEIAATETPSTQHMDITDIER
jgi:hypothetical protein